MRRQEGHSCFHLQTWRCHANRDLREQVSLTTAACLNFWGLFGPLPTSFSTAAKEKRKTLVKTLQWWPWGLG
jgi:hypothetical protein